MKTFEEAHWAERDAAADCRLCEGTGYVQRGMVIHHAWVDDTVDWITSLVACSHGVVSTGLSASQDRPGEVDTHRADATGPVGGDTDGEVTGRAGASEAGPVASSPAAVTVGTVDVAYDGTPLASFDVVAHDAQVEADTAAYEKRNGGGP